MELNYKEFGQGDPIIILHGLFGTLDNWQTIAKQLAEDYSVFIIDQRNHGRSPHDSAFNYELMAEDLHYFMESQWIHKAHIIGHSMGGKTAMQFALNYPDMVDHLVVVDIAPKAYEGSHHLIFDALLNLPISKLKSRKEADDLLQEKIPEYSVRQFLLKNLTRNKEGGYQWKMNLPVIFKHYDKVLEAMPSQDVFEGPSLFLKGEKSKHIQASDDTLIKALFPKAKIHTITNAGHWVHADSPKELLHEIQQFLSLN